MGSFLAFTAILMSACGDDSEDAVAAPTTEVEVTARNRSRATTTTISLEPVVSVLVEPGTRDDFDLAKDDVNGLLCTFADDIWNASGTVTNPTATKADYRIYLTFVDQAGAFRGLLEVDVADVDPDETVPWEGHLTLLDPSVTCMLRVERAAE